MSMIKCKTCENIADSDKYPDGWIETKYGDEFHCQSCTEEKQAYHDKGEHMAALARDGQ